MAQFVFSGSRSSVDPYEAGHKWPFHDLFYTCSCAYVDYLHRKDHCSKCSSSHIEMVSVLVRAIFHAEGFSKHECDTISYENIADHVGHFLSLDELSRIISDRKATKPKKLFRSLKGPNLWLLPIPIHVASDEGFQQHCVSNTDYWITTFGSGSHTLHSSESLEDMLSNPDVDVTSVSSWTDLVNSGLICIPKSDDWLTLMKTHIPHYDALKLQVPNNEDWYVLSGEYFPSVAHYAFVPIDFDSIRKYHFDPEYFGKSKTKRFIFNTMLSMGFYSLRHDYVFGSYSDWYLPEKYVSFLHDGGYCTTRSAKVGALRQGRSDWKGRIKL